MNTFIRRRFVGDYFRVWERFERWITKDIPQIMVVVDSHSY